MTDELAPLVPDLGPLVAALAKAQARFPTITRDKTVVVQTKSGNSYTFKYAPLDSILGAVREPLASNGLAVVQVLDAGGLVTSLMHESGAVITGRVDLPTNTDIQGLGSAITYLRRYAIQAMLGIAAEEDDDGNRAAGNQIIPSGVERSSDGGLIGVVEVGTTDNSDFLIRTDEERGSATGFRLVSAKGDKGGTLLRAFGALADQLVEARKLVVDKRVTAWGRIEDIHVPAKGNKRGWSYQVLTADRVSVPGLGVLPVDTTPEASGPPDGPGELTEQESEALWAEMDRIGA